MKKAIVLLGPTGAGKTGVSLLLAKTLSTEIISADSMQVYRGMDIGTAKPSPEERKLIRHHMLDVVEPSEEYSTGRYIEDVAPIIEGLHREGKIPIVVGGTGLYIRAMTRGLFRGPSADWSLREELLSMEEAETGSLYKYLEDVDPETASKAMPGDIRRIVRALEVFLSGEKISEMKKNTSPLPYDFIKIGITRQRAELYGLIEKRVERMLGAGLLDEVKNLMSKNPSRTPMQAIGYKEVAGYLNDEYPLSEAVRLIKRNTKRYAKRQFTWFKKEENIQWMDVTGIYESGEIFKKAMEAIKGKL